MSNQYTEGQKLCRPIKDRFMAKVQVNIVTGCWEWIGARNNHEQGQFVVEHKKVLAYRFSWELHRGKIPEGMYVCHKCDNPPCVNPDHLFLGTQSDNIRDCVSKGRLHNWNKAKTVCKRGHAFTPENTYLIKGVRRACAICRRMLTRISAQKRRDKQKAAAAIQPQLL
jgi:hypothetical protein